MFDQRIGAEIAETGVIDIFLPIMGEFVAKNSDFSPANRWGIEYNGSICVNPISHLQGLNRQDLINFHSDS